MKEYRIPEENQKQDEDDAIILAVLDATVRDATSLKVAVALEEDPAVVEMWIDRTWDGLRDSLDDEQRLAAILLLLDDRINAKYVDVLHGLKVAGDA